MASDGRPPVIFASRSRVMSKWLQRAALAVVTAGLLFNLGCAWTGLGGLLSWKRIMMDVAIGSIFD